MRMKTYTFVIGSMDDFETIGALDDYVEQHGSDGMANYSVFEFDCPSSCDERTVIQIGRGLAFSNDWCMDGTFSFLFEGTVEDYSNDYDNPQISLPM